MKKIIIISLLVLSSVFAASAQPSNGIQFEEGTFSQILDKAREEGKFVFLDIYTTWCGPCQRMQNEVFPDQEVGKYFNSTFVNAKFDAEKGEGVFLAQRYNVTGYPTFLLIDADGRLVGKLIGGSPPNDFIEQVSQLRENALKNM